MSSWRRLVRLKGRALIGGKATGRLYVVPKAVSFYGELEDLNLKNSVLVVRRTRGSTVAPYVIYRMWHEGRAPEAIIIVEKAEPMVIAGAILAGIPLCDMLTGISVTQLIDLNDCVANVSSLKESRVCDITIAC